jgi:hypothetical protein
MAFNGLDPRMVAALLYLVELRNPIERHDSMHHTLRGMFRSVRFWRRYPYDNIEYFERELNRSSETRRVANRHFQFMEKTGLIKRISQAGNSDNPPWDEYRLSTSDELGEQFPVDGGESHDGGGRGGNGPGKGGGGRGGDDDGRGGGDNNEGSGGGIREVLGHRTLFALPKDEFDDLVSRLFEGPGSP